MTTSTMTTMPGSTTVRRRPPHHRPLRAIRDERRSRHAPAERLVGIPVPGSWQFRRWIAWLADRFLQPGGSPMEDHLQALAALADAYGVEPQAARTLADRGAPELARARAFFTVAAVLDPDDPDAPRRVLAA